MQSRPSAQSRSVFVATLRLAESVPRHACRLRAVLQCATPAIAVPNAPSRRAEGPRRIESSSRPGRMTDVHRNADAGDDCGLQGDVSQRGLEA
eukprot:7383479-Prymnesium_polylepis.1